MKNFIAGRYVQQGYYSCFVPQTISRDWVVDDVEIMTLFGQAERAVGKLDMFSDYIPNIDLFINMHSVKEAIQSTRIEGTQTNMEEALKSRTDIPARGRDDWDEVQNYLRAMRLATQELTNLPFSARLIKRLHLELLQGVRGENKLPGEFRKSQNWIGGATINDATFIPPIDSLVPELIGDLEKFAHNDQIRLPELIKIAIIHYQFETIHPFLDGNGRIGRLLIPLYLVDKGLLKIPTLYISDFFERHRKLYYDNLMGVRADNNIKQWIKFFLVGIIEICRSGVQTFDLILKLQREVDIKISSIQSISYSAKPLIEHLYINPYVNATQVADIISKSPASAYKLIEELVRLGILVEVTGGKRSKQYVFQDYLKIFTV